MNIISTESLKIPDIKVIRFARHNDNRGYFTETYNKNDLLESIPFIANNNFQQTNEVFSLKNTFRGLHIQFAPKMGKLVRLIYGKLIDFALDLRKESPTYKHIIGYEVLSTCEFGEWIWLPPGFAHGTLLLENSMVEYYCSTTYNPINEFCVSIFADDINWKLCDKNVLSQFNEIDRYKLLIKERDLEATNIATWERNGH